MGDPQVTMGFNRNALLTWMIWGYPYLRKSPKSPISTGSVSWRVDHAMRLTEKDVYCLRHHSGIRSTTQVRYLEVLYNWIKAIADFYPEWLSLPKKSCVHYSSHMFVVGSPNILPYCDGSVRIYQLCLAWKGTTWWYPLQLWLMTVISPCIVGL